MRVLVIVKGDEDSETGAPPDGMFEQMAEYNQKLIDAGIMLSGEGLLPSSRGKRVRFDGARRTVTDGPFPNSEELVAGFWIWRVKSMDEAVEWLKQAPFDHGATIEIRPIAELEDFGDAMSDEVKAKETAQRAQLEKRA